MRQKETGQGGRIRSEPLDDVDVHLVAIPANCTIAVYIPLTVDEIIHIAAVPLAINHYILKIEFSRFGE